MKSALTLTLSLAFLCIAVQARAPLSTDERAVLHTEHSWNQAYVEADPTKLAEIESDAYVYTEPDGSVHTKADELADAKAGLMNFSEMSLHEASVRITGDTAVVTGRLVVSGGLPGHGFGEILESTDTLVRQDGRWRAAASAEIKLADTAQSAVAPLWRDGGDWLKRHEGFVADAKNGGVELLFIGDSITDLWRERGRATWDKYYGRRHAANIGISGDRTQHVLWRLGHGEVDGLNPKVIVLMIGTNNTGFELDETTPRNTPAEAADGVKAIVGDLRRRIPGATILLLGIFPRGHSPGTPTRAQVAEVNRSMARLDDGHHIRFLDIGEHFLTKDGILEESVMPDFLHPSPKGYEIWAEAMEPVLAPLLGSSG